METESIVSQGDKKKTSVNRMAMTSSIQLVYNNNNSRPVNLSP